MIYFVAHWHQGGWFAVLSVLPTMLALFVFMTADGYDTDRLGRDE